MAASNRPPPLPPRARTSSPPPAYSEFSGDATAREDAPTSMLDESITGAPARPLPPPLPLRAATITMLDNSNASASSSLFMPSRSSSPSATADGSSDVGGLGRKDTIHLTPYTIVNPRPGVSPSGSSPARGDGDPRSSSMTSLLPVDTSARGDRRMLLLIYIHGFVGNETSFQSFPAHVHNLLTLHLAESHVVHTKIYPRYKSRRNISFAADDFSNWLAPHESPKTDVVLLGHSLGGILAAEVVLLPTHTPGSEDIFQHRILGIIAIDTPFLGMHPSVVGTGIASLFNPPPKTPNTLTPSTSVSSPGPASSTTLLSPSTSTISDPFSLPENDPNYNPAFPNDINLPTRGKIDSFFYFWNKHSGEIQKAVSSFVTSHLEFGGCLADYPSLHRRYGSIRNLEDIDPSSHPKDAQGRSIPRVRFTNYYSASTGRVKQKIKRSDSQTSAVLPEGAVPDSLSQQSTRSKSSHRSLSRSPSVRSFRSARSQRSTQRQWGDELTTKAGDTPPDFISFPEGSPQPLTILDSTGERPASSNCEMAELDPQHIESDEQETAVGKRPETSEGPPAADDYPSIPSLPKPPRKPEEKDYALKDFFKASLTAYARELKKYEQEKKAYDRAVKARDKMIKADLKSTMKATSREEKERAKAEKQRIKEEQKNIKAERQAKDVQEKHQLKRRATLNQETYDEALRMEAEEQGVPEDKVQNKKRDRKFCALPSKNPKTGERDATWVRVYMEGVDEIAAHTGMFFMSETYAKLVGDTAERIERWVKEAGLAD